MDGSYFWLDECGQRVYDHPSVSVNELKLTIEPYIYRNLERFLDELLIGSSKSNIRLYSTDGNYWFSSIENGITSDAKDDFIAFIKKPEEKKEIITLLESEVEEDDLAETISLLEYWADEYIEEA